MHSALLIDEILRQVFCFSENDRSSLLYSACTCKAWKEPALDFIWDHLSSFGPLLLLLPGVYMRNGEYVFGNRSPYDELTVFKSYARRVKHINHRQAVKINSGLAALSPFMFTWEFALPNLATAHITMPKCNTMLMPLTLSPSLRHLDIDLGFKATSPFNDTALCDYLEQASTCCLELRQLSLRGRGSKQLNAVIAGMTHLNTMSLRLGRSLLPETLNAIVEFPHLSELEIHAGHMEHNDLDDLHESYPYTTFASLRKLSIRAKTPLVEAILQHVQPNTLQHLQIDLDDTGAPSTSWNTIFSLASEKAAYTLTYLTLEHHFEVEETTSPIPSDTNPIANNIPQHTGPSMSFETLQILGGLKNLHHFSCDVTLPPIITDRDVEKLATWWPDLEYLMFGSAPQAHDIEGDAVGSPHMTVASLYFFATKMPKLKKLTLPLTIGDVSSFPAVPCLSQAISGSQLQVLTISQLKTSKLIEVAHYLRLLFPAVEILEGLHEHNQVWEAINDVLQNIVSNLV